MFCFKAVTTICFFALLLPARSAQFDTNECREQIEGTWKLKVVRVGQGVSFDAFMSFTAGGVVLATGSLDRQEPVSPVFGSWKRSGRRGVDVTIYFFLFDQSGNAIGTLKTNETFHLDGKDSMTGTGSSYTCDVATENCGSAPVGEVTLAGTRIEAEGVNDR